MGIFHRYSSTIHGNYRRAYLRCGLLTGALVRLLAGRPMESPLSLIVDIIFIVVLFLLTAWYRNSLPEKKITLKEAMLFGMGTATVAGVVYGLALWVIGINSASQTVLFTTTMTGNEVGLQDPQLHYWAAWWAIVSAIFFRNEKGMIRNKNNN